MDREIRRVKYSTLDEMISRCLDYIADAREQMAGSNYLPGEHDQFMRLRDLLEMANAEAEWLKHHLRDRRRHP